MKNRYDLLFFLVLLAFPFAEASAQIVVIRADYDDLLGKTAISTDYFAVLDQDAQIIALLGQTGDGETWDMTALNFDEAFTRTRTTEYIALPAGLPGEDNPNAQGANYAIRVISTSDNQGGDFNINFYTISDADVRLHGTHAVSDNMTSELFYDPPYVVHPFPWQNGSRWQAAFTWIVTTPGVPTTTQVNNGVVNGEGTLITPAGTVDAFRSEVTSTNSIGGVPVVTNTLVSFESKFQIIGGIPTRIAAIVIKTTSIPTGATMYFATYTTDELSDDPTEPPANAPGNLSPAEGASVSQTPGLSWNSLLDASAYWLQVGDNPGFTKRGSATLLVDQQGIESTNFTVNGLAAGTTYYWRVRGQNARGDGPWSNGRSFTTASGVAVERLDGDVPSDFRLYPSYPNPFNPKTTIKFDIAAPSVVRLAIYDALGRQVEVLVSEQLTPGRYAYSWDARTHPSGLFIYRLDAGAFSQSGGMMLIK